MSTPEIERVFEWKDGVIVEFEAYAMHTDEGGGEVWDKELSVFQRGIVLGDEVVGCDYELSKEDFINGVWVDGIDTGGGYHADEYIRATLCEPEWLTTLLTTHDAEIREKIEAIRGVYSAHDALEAVKSLLTPKK